MNHNQTSNNQSGCLHPSWYKERIKGLGAATGDFICSSCGYLADGREKERLVQERHSILNSKHRNIARRDVPSDGICGWQVQIIDNGVYRSKFFADRKLGGRDRSLMSAIAWRDSLKMNNEKESRND